VGSDISVSKGLGEESNDSFLDEFKLREFIEQNLESRGGLIKSYTF